MKRKKTGGKGHKCYIPHYCHVRSFYAINMIVTNILPWRLRFYASTLIIGTPPVSRRAVKPFLMHFFFIKSFRSKANIM